MTPHATSRSIWFWPAVIWLNLQLYTLVILFTAVFGAIALSYIGLHRLVTRNNRRNRWLIRRTISRYGGVVVRLGWPLATVSYVDLDPAAQPPYVVMANHPSSSDGFLPCFLPVEAVQMLNIWPAHLPVIGFMAQLAEYLKPREVPFEEFLAAGSRLISQGVSVIAFPEGTRSGYAPMGQFHGSAFRLAMHNSVPVIPYAIWGNQAMPPKGSFFFRPGHIIVTKLPAVQPAEYEGQTPFQLKSRVRGTILQYLDQLSAKHGSPA